MQALELLYQALGTPLGIVIKVSDSSLASQRLYKARANSGDSDLDQLQIRKSPYSADELWIVRSKPQLPSKVSNGQE